MQTMFEEETFTPEVAAAFAHLFNQKLGAMANPLDAETLLAHPRGQIGKEGCFCYYSLFRRQGVPLLATYTGHRMTNENYAEWALDGSLVFGWGSMAGLRPLSGHSHEYLRGFRLARRRGTRVGIKVYGP